MLNQQIEWAGRKRKQQPSYSERWQAIFEENCAVRYLVALRMANCRAFSGSAFNSYAELKIKLHN